MKILKYLIIFVLILGIGLVGWAYYPQYQIQKMKKQIVNVNVNNPQLSYIDYFRSIDQTQIHNLAIGDSVIRGVGAPENGDLVYQFSSKLEDQIGKKILFQNEGINGITSGELNELIQKGRFDEEIKRSDIITINVGGNDILRVAMGQDFYRAFKTFDQLQTTFSKNLTEITLRIKKLNPNATVVFLELYNPLSIENQYYPLADKLLPAWNLKIYQVANHTTNSLVIETTKVINGENSQNISEDGVHPNTAGYLAISEEMLYQFSHQYRKTSV